MTSPRAETAALRPVELEHHVPQLGRGAARSAVEPPAEDEPAADPRAEREHDHVLRTAAGADRPFGHRRGVRVVVDRDRQPQVLLAALSQRDALERDMHGEDRRAFALVDRRRDADADGGHAVVPQAVDDLGEARSRNASVDSVGVSRRSVRENRAVALDDPREDLRAADVDTDGALGRHDRRLP